MSWLHCFWGVGTMIGPVVMSRFISSGGLWTQGYRAISIFQMFLTGVLLLSLPLWKNVEKKKAEDNEQKEDSTEALKKEDFDSPSNEVTLKSALRIPGVFSAVLCFLCYCAIEATTGFWATSYMFFARGIEINLATSWAMLFFIGITVGRFLNGFLSEKFGDKRMIRLGLLLITLALLLMALPLANKWIVFSVFILAGLGCAPLFPCMIHATPGRFGEKNSQAVIGLQMAFSYAGSTFCPPIFGLIVQKLSIKLLPFYGLIFVILFIIFNENLNRKKAA